MGPVASVIGAVAAVVGTVGSLAMQAKALKEQKKAAGFQREAALKQQEQQDLAYRKSQRQAIREAQIVRAQATMSAVGAGTVGSSGFYGGIGSVTSQLGTELGYGSASAAMSRYIGGKQTQANDALAAAGQASAMSNIFGGIANLGGSIYQASGGFSFGSRSAPTASAVPNYTTPRYSTPTPTRAPVPTAPYNPTVRTYGYAM